MTFIFKRGKQEREVVESDLTNVDTEGGICTPSTEQQGFLLELGKIMNVLGDMLKLEDIVMPIF